MRWDITSATVDLKVSGIINQISHLVLIKLADFVSLSKVSFF